MTVRAHGRSKLSNKPTNMETSGVKCRFRETNSRRIENI